MTKYTFLMIMSLGAFLALAMFFQGMDDGMDRAHNEARVNACMARGYTAEMCEVL